MNEIAATATSVPPTQKRSADQHRLSPAGGNAATTKKLPQPTNGRATKTMAAYETSPRRCSPCGSIIAPAMSSGRPKIAVIAYTASGPETRRPRQDGTLAKHGFDHG